MCDHGVFVLIYVGLALSIHTVEGWSLAVAAGVAHAVQANFYESERARFHRRISVAAMPARPQSGNVLVRLYDTVALTLDRFARNFDSTLYEAHDPPTIAAAYREAATPPMRLMSLLSANVRVEVIFLACLARDPRLFWWIEIGPLSAILMASLAWHRRVEHRLIDRTVGGLGPASQP
jgi:hypothetical protein